VNPPPGNYLMTWAGRAQRVTVLVWFGDLVFRTASGWDHPVSTVPDARWEVVS
jgi:hypothetical protein